MTAFIQFFAYYFCYYFFYGSNSDLCMKPTVNA